MKIFVLSCALFLGLDVPSLRAGSVSLLAGTPDVKGKLSLEAGKIKIDTGASPEEVSLPDVLEADFNDAPFQLNCFYSRQFPGTQLPPGWKAVDLQPSKPPGSCSYKDGVFTLSGTGSAFGAKNDDQFFFVGCPWTGDGQWTVHLSPADATAEMGLMWRRSLDVDSLMFAMGFKPGGGGGWFHGRQEGKAAGWTDFTVENATWLRLTRSGSSLQKEVSSDRKEWDSIGQDTVQFPDNTWIGLMISSHQDGVLGKGVADNVEFTPGEAEPETVPPGVLLRSGTFLAGSFQFFTGKTGNYIRNGQQFLLDRDHVSAVVAHPVTRRRIAKVSDKPGIILKNGDFMESDVQSIQGSYFEMNSLIIGPVSYGTDTTACVLQPEQPVPSAYEIRLHDGSIVRAKSLSVDKGQVTIEEISGLTLKAAPEEIVQIRAGLSRAQTLIDVPWKVSSPEAATDALPPVQCWEGTNQEQIMVVSAGTKVEFPLAGKFRALSLRVAVSPDAAATAQATVHILVDGKEIGRTVSLRAGDQPQSLAATLQGAKSVTLTVSSADAGTRALLIDPVAIRQ